MGASPNLLMLVALAALSAGCDGLKARFLAQEGVAAFRQGKTAESVEKFELAAKLDPRIATIQLNLGYASMALYQSAPKSPEGQASAKRAVLAFERFLELKPTEERARTYLIQTFIDTGRYDDAVAFFKAAVEKTPPDGPALTTLGIIAGKTGRVEEAKAWYEKQVAAYPNDPDAHLALGAVQWQLLHGNAAVVGDARIAAADVGIAQLAETIRLKPNLPNAYDYTERLYQERALGQPDEDKKRLDLEESLKFHAKFEQHRKGVK